MRCKIVNGKYRILLTKVEERSLVLEAQKEMASGDTRGTLGWSTKEISSLIDLSKKQINDLDSASAVERLLFVNIRKVAKVAKTQYEKYKKAIPDWVEIDDLLIEGIVGFLMAIKKFNLSKKTLFFSYAYYWVEKYILLSIVNVFFETVKIPEYIFFERVRVLRCFTGNPIDEEDEERGRKAIKKLGIENVDSWLGMVFVNTIKLDIGGDIVFYKTALGYFTRLVKELREASEDRGELLPVSGAITRVGMDDLLKKLFKKAKLTDMEIDIISRNGSLGGCEFMSLKALARKYKKREQSIQRVKERALDKLKLVAKN